MAYEPPIYPSSIPSQTGETPDLPDAIDDITWWVAAMYNGVKRELCAIMAELGTLPKGEYADVKTRLAASMSNPMTALADLITGGADGAPGRLPVGAANLKLFVNAAGNGLEWSAGIYLKLFTKDMTEASCDTAYTGVGFKPSHIIILAGKHVTPMVSMGFDDGTQHFYFANIHGVSPYNWGMSAVASVGLFEKASTNQIAQVLTMDPDGFTLHWVKAGTTAAGNANCGALCFR